MLRIVVERIANGQRLRHGGGPYLHTVLANDAGFSPLPFVVRSCNSKLVEPVAIANLQTLAHIGKSQHDFWSGNHCRPKRGARLSDFASVDLRQGPLRHAPAHVQFVLRVDIVRLTDIDRYNQSGVGCGQGSAALFLAYVAPGLVGRLRFWIAIVGQLDNAETKIALAPTLAPGLDHSRQKDSILLSPGLV